LSDSFVFLPNTPGAFHLNWFFNRYIFLWSPLEGKIHSFLVWLLVSIKIW
jgi:hypothetical protein